MEYQTYDALIKLITEFRLEHHNAKGVVLDKFVKKIFRMDQTILREIGGTSHMMQIGR